MTGPRIPSRTPSADFRQLVLGQKLRLVHGGLQAGQASRGGRREGSGSATPYGSSFRIVPTPCPSAIVAFVGLLRFTKKVSSLSLTLSF